MSVSRAVKRVGIRGLLQVARETLVALLATRRRPRRAAYAVEQRAPSTKAPRESIPIDAAAMLAGIYEFLSDLPELTKRRATFQDRRRVSDAELFRQFGTHWLSPSPARFQLEHDAFQIALIEQFALAEISPPPASHDNREECASRP